MPRILLVNDVAIVNKIMKRKLETEPGFEVDTALTGNEGISKARENEYDIFLLDYYLPDISGEEVCAAVKTDGRSPKSPVYFVSSMDKVSMEAVIQKTGAQGHLDMTMDISVLAEKIKALIGV